MVWTELQVLFHTHLMLQAAVLSLRVLPDDHDVDVSVACPHSWQRLAVHHVGVQIQSGAAEGKRTERKTETRGGVRQSPILLLLINPSAVGKLFRKPYN